MHEHVLHQPLYVQAVFDEESGYEHTTSQIVPVRWATTFTQLAASPAVTGGKSTISGVLISGQKPVRGVTVMPCLTADSETCDPARSVPATVSSDGHFHAITRPLHHLPAYYIANFDGTPQLAPASSAPTTTQLPSAVNRNH